MKISNCPICGREPQIVKEMPYTTIFCYGHADTAHRRFGTGRYRSQGAAVMFWETIVRNANSMKGKACVNGNCSIRATCARYHQAANVFEARGADGLYDSHSCRKGKCAHHLAKEVQP